MDILRKVVSKTPSVWVEGEARTNPLRQSNGFAAPFLYTPICTVLTHRQTRQLTTSCSSLLPFPSPHRIY